ncbi:hypothetical protein AQUCO_00900519v1 [Aquilegia coerulea]|uniref:Uncharacterized protein n=1 Tax=Aquilegia coerulea TaxID=218851 RepID=A0A2G5EE10_AQUCA|nr:hypothetical protein AQUCO_00900519v1 [Aquilegia coerulea]
MNSKDKNFAIDVLSIKICIIAANWMIYHSLMPIPTNNTQYFHYNLTCITEPKFICQIIPNVLLLLYTYCWQLALLEAAGLEENHLVGVVGNLE